MLENLNFISFILKFYIFWSFIFLIGRSIYITLCFFSKKSFTPNTTFIARGSIFIFYPVIGLIFLGNFLFITHFFIPIGNIQIVMISLYSLVLNLKNLPKLNNLSFGFYELNSILIIPLIILITSYDIAFHYDAGYYHLNHQNWLQESNIIIGIVNIFWPYGIGSIYEYISAFFWFDRSFILLHFINIVFINFFFMFSLEHIFKIKNSFLKFPSIFVVLFAVLDNIGIQGGRNGYFYIQGVTASDLVVGIIFYTASLLLIYRIQNLKYLLVEFHTYALLVLFLFQMKLSAIFISILFFIYVFKLISNEILNLNKILKLMSPYTAITLLWTIKSVLTNGCLIFPLNLSCFNFLDWYQKGSTKDYELVTVNYSQSYKIGTSLSQWAVNIFNDDLKRSVFVNFFVSLLFILFIKKMFFNSKFITSELKVILLLFISINLIYFVLAGPIPRYGIGMMMFSIACLGMNVNEWKYEYNYHHLVYILFFSALVLTPRLSSYQSFNMKSSPSVHLPKIEYSTINKDWVKPSEGDRCWVNLKCVIDGSNLYLDDSGIFIAFERN